MKGAGETDILKSLSFYCPSAVPSPGLSLNPLCQKSHIWPWTCIRAGAPPEKIGNPPPRDQPTSLPAREGSLPVWSACCRPPRQWASLAAALSRPSPRIPPCGAVHKTITRQSQDNHKTIHKTIQNITQNGHFASCSLEKEKTYNIIFSFLMRTTKCPFCVVF